jgi:ankyrin repeat protein
MTNQKGSTALSEAAVEGHASVVTLLLGAKADVNHANNVSSNSFPTIIELVYLCLKLEVIIVPCELLLYNRIQHHMIAQCLTRPCLI